VKGKEFSSCSKEVVNQGQRIVESKGNLLSKSVVWCNWKELGSKAPHSVVWCNWKELGSKAPHSGLQLKEVKIHNIVRR